MMRYIKFTLLVLFIEGFAMVSRGNGIPLIDQNASRHLEWAVSGDQKRALESLMVYIKHE